MIRSLRNLPLTWRLVLLSAVSLLSVTIISTLIAREVMQSEFDRIRDRELALMRDHVLADLTDLNAIPETSFASLGPPRFTEIFSGAYWQFQAASPSEGMQLRSRSLWDGSIGERRSDSESSGFGFASGPAGEQLRIWTGPASAAGTVGTLMVGVSMADHLAMQERVGWLFTIALVVEGILALAVAAIAAVISLQSIRRFTSDLQALREGETDELDENLSSEIAMAAQEVNALKTAQTRVITRAREQAAALAHSLKTPLAVIIQAAEKSGGPEAGEIRRQADAALTHVHHHLTMARSAAPLALRKATSLRPVADGIVRVLQPRAVERDISIEVSVEEAFQLPVEEADLHDIVGNLVENAVRHATSAVHLQAGRDGTGLFVHINDDGPGLSESERDTAMQRGFSDANSAQATGLGLSITGELVESYGGQFELGRSELGGLQVTLRFGSF